MTTIPTTILHRTNIVHVCIVICIEMIWIKAITRSLEGKKILSTSIFHWETLKLTITNSSGQEKTKINE